MTGPNTTVTSRPQRQIEDAHLTGGGDPFQVVLYNDDIHAFDVVVRQVQKATGVPEAKAVAITLLAHETGRAICFVGAREQCLGVADVLREIGLQVEVDRC